MSGKSTPVTPSAKETPKSGTGTPTDNFEKGTIQLREFMTSPTGIGAVVGVAVLIFILSILIFNYGGKENLVIFAVFVVAVFAISSVVMRMRKRKSE